MQLESSNALNTASAAGMANSTGNSTADIQQRFLTLLITQIKNQDPLNPLDNAEVTSQLAQLNMVGGIERLNTTIEGLANGFRAAQTLQAASLLGRSVLVPGETIDNAGQGGRFGVELNNGVESLTVRVLDLAGNVVERIDLGAQPAGVHGLEWDAIGANGEPMPPGSYRVEVEATSGGKKSDAAVLSAHRVAAVTTQANTILIELAGVGAVTLDQVRQILS